MHDRGTGSEPGLDRHAWATRYAEVEAALHDDPEEGLLELAALLQQMLDEVHARPGDIVFTETERLAAYRDAKDLAERARSGEDLSPGDVGYAVRELRDLYFSLAEERRAH